MTNYAWFPLTTSSTPYTWNPVGNWNDGAFWANASTVTNPPTTGTVPGPSDNAYIVAAASAFAPPAPYPAPPYPVTVDLDETNVTIANLGMAGFGLFALPIYPTLAITSVSLDVTGAIVDSFTAAFPNPIGTQSFTGGGTITLASGGSLEIGTAAGSNVTVDFTDATADRVTLAGVAASAETAFAGLIEGFGVGNVIDLSSVVFAGLSKNFADGVLTVSDGITPVAALRMAGTYTTDSFDLKDDGTGHTDIILVCYASGTRIATGVGETAVEDLGVGDRVVCLEAGQRVLRPVTWIGQRRIDLTSHRDPDLAAPIRVRRDAFAEGQPHRDLVLSPDHCVYVDGGLIPVRLLVNGMSVVRDRHAPSVHYWHVELDRHSVLLAEGLPAESYLDTGNRGFFRNGGAAIDLHPSFQVAAGHASWATHACAPLTVDEASVRPVWQRLAERAATHGHVAPPAPAAADPDVHLLVDGRPIRPVSTGHGSYAFEVPQGARQMHIVSHAARPSDRAPWLDDRRRLGLPVTRIVLRADGEDVVISAEHPALQEGWHATEQDTSARWRWTDGRAAVPLPASTAGMVAELHVRSAA